MKKEYITKYGDTWDIISKSVYGSELYTDFLMKNNSKYIDIVIFDQGYKLDILDIPKINNKLIAGWRIR